MGNIVGFPNCCGAYVGTSYVFPGNASEGVVELTNHAKTTYGGIVFYACLDPTQETDEEFKKHGWERWGSWKGQYKSCYTSFKNPKIQEKANGRYGYNMVLYAFVKKKAVPEWDFTNPENLK